MAIVSKSECEVTPLFESVAPINGISPSGLSSGFLLLFAYVVLYTLGVFSHIKVLNDFAASISVLLMMLMEILIDIGLIQNNGRYVKNFTQSMMDIRIKDEEGNILYKTATDNNSI